MSGRSRTSRAKNCTAAASVISSPALADGPLPCNSPGGPQLDLFGQVVVPASRSATRAKGLAKPMPDTSGPISFGSSRSAALQLSLANRLLALVDTDGSPEYVLTWKRRAMLSGVRICRLVARARRTSETVYFGWPTPDTGSNGGRVSARPGAKVRPTGTKQQFNLADATQLIQFKPWNTPKVATGAYQYSNGNHDKKILNLEGQATVLLKSWATRRARDHKNNGVSIARAAKGVADSLDLQCKPVCRSGTAQPSPLSAWMARDGYRLNPAHSRWLQGYPAAWCDCAAMAIVSCRKSRPRSSGRSSKQKAGDK